MASLTDAEVKGLPRDEAYRRMGFPPGMTFPRGIAYNDKVTQPNPSGVSYYPEGQAHLAQQFRPWDAKGPPVVNVGPTVPVTSGPPPVTTPTMTDAQWNENFVKRSNIGDIHAPPMNPYLPTGNLNKVREAPPENAEPATAFPPATRQLVFGTSSSTEGDNKVAAQKELSPWITGPMGREQDRGEQLYGPVKPYTGLPPGVTEEYGGIWRRGNTFTNMGLAGLNDIDKQKRQNIPATAGFGYGGFGSYGGNDALSQARRAAADRGDFEAISNSYGGNFNGGRNAAGAPIVPSPVSSILEDLKTRINAVANDDSFMGRLQHRNLMLQFAKMNELDQKQQELGINTGELGVHQRRASVEEEKLPIDKMNALAAQQQANAAYTHVFWPAMNARAQWEAMNRGITEGTNYNAAARGAIANEKITPGTVIVGQDLARSGVTTSPMAGLPPTPVVPYRPTTGMPEPQRK